MPNADVWDRRFLQAAELIASWSKDPSTQTGAIIVDPYRRIVSTGYNGFPRNIADTEARLNDRELKYQLVIHAEINAILFSNRSLRGCTLYGWPLQCCTRCAVVIIQSQIIRVVTPWLPVDRADRWGPDCARALDLFHEAGIEVVLL